MPNMNTSINNIAIRGGSSYRDRIPNYAIIRSDTNELRA